VIYNITTEEDGKTRLQLGLNHAVTFDTDCGIEDIAGGVTLLIEQTVGVSAFDMVKDVAEQMGIIDKDGVIVANG
jgi:hypothetical protein